jgi:exopolyphosphatase/guanosine-5'-triphosphate,3'-diphosphate pyrophosphatase
MRIAAIDIGTNSIHVLIAKTTALGAFEVIDREREAVQIGSGSFTRGRLEREAIRRTVDALARYVELARRHGVDEILCTATAAVREAENGGDFIAASRRATGITPRVIPAEEEGRLIYLAVKNALPLGEKPDVIFDIGGGSVQLVVGHREGMEAALSVPLGALRLTETAFESDPPTRRELAATARRIGKLARSALKQVAALAPARALGSSGSIHAMGHVVEWLEHGRPLEQVNGHVVRTASLERAVRALARMTAAERERLPCLEAARARIIVAGGLVLVHLLRKLGMDSITLSDDGVREGLIADWIASESKTSGLGAVEDLRLRSVLALLARFQADGPHPRHVARLALGLHDALRVVHRLPPEGRELLHFAALLHDLGGMIGYDRHAEHSAYIIRHGNLRGLSGREISIIALAARYHGKARPRKKDPAYRAMAPADRRMTRWLVALLKVAEALDRSHYQLVRGFRVERRKRRAAILLDAGPAARLEVWAARRRLGLLSRLLGGKSRKRKSRQWVTVAIDAIRPAQRSTARLPEPTPVLPRVVQETSRGTAVERPPRSRVETRRASSPAFSSTDRVASIVSNR